METIKILDVTLRDGGYKNNFMFTDDFICHVVNGLDRTGVEYIEVGYRNGSFKPMADVGVAGLCQKKYLDLCRRQISRSKLTVMLHPKNVKKEDIQEMRDCGVDSIRVCFPANDDALGRRTIDMIQQSGMELFLNITRASNYKREELIKLAVKLAQHEPRCIYLADSNGSLTPEEVGNLYSHLAEVVSVPLGFHAHDNLFLAQANAIAAIKHGVKYIDSSLHGLGKGAGNLRTEGLISFLCSKRVTRYDLCALLDTASSVKYQFNDDVLSIKDIIMGVFDLSQDDALKLGAFMNANQYYVCAKEYSESSSIRVR